MTCFLLTCYILCIQGMLNMMGKDDDTNPKLKRSFITLNKMSNNTGALKVFLDFFIRADEDGDGEIDMEEMCKIFGRSI